MKYRELHPWKFEVMADEILPTNIIGFEVEHEYFSLNRYGDLLIRKHYKWDGATCAINTRNNRVPSAFHDCCYQMIRLGLLPPELKGLVDYSFKQMLLARGMSRVRAEYFYLAVRLRGGKYCVPGTDPVYIIYEAA